MAKSDYDAKEEDSLGLERSKSIRVHIIIMIVKCISARLARGATQFTWCVCGFFLYRPLTIDDRLLSKMAIRYSFLLARPNLNHCNDVGHNSKNHLYIKILILILSIKVVFLFDFSVFLFFFGVIYSNLLFAKRYSLPTSIANNRDRTRPIWINLPILSIQYYFALILRFHSNLSSFAVNDANSLYFILCLDL